MSLRMPSCCMWILGRFCRWCGRWLGLVRSRPPRFWSRRSVSMLQPSHLRPSILVLLLATIPSFRYERSGFGSSAPAGPPPAAPD